MKDRCVSFIPIGFHDVYYCKITNEPFIVTYSKDKKKICSECKCELEDVNHIFICHINKHEVKNIYIWRILNESIS